MRKRWLSKRAVGLHALLAVVFPLCLLAGWWQVHRALSGNFLSYLYSVEWPAFAVLAVVAWWQLLHDVPVAVAGPAPDGPLASEAAGQDGGDLGPSWLSWDPALETPELRAYNDRLYELALGGARKTWRNPRGLPRDGEGGVHAEAEVVVP
jgi:hypothetical protein